MLAEYSKNAAKKKISQKKAVRVSPTPPSHALTIGPTDYKEPNVVAYVTSDNAIAYVSGFLLKKCFKLHTCLRCTDDFSSTELDDNGLLFCQSKAFHVKSDFGCLHSASSKYLEYIIKLEDTFGEVFCPHKECRCWSK